MTAAGTADHDRDNRNSTLAEGTEPAVPVRPVAGPDLQRRTRPRQGHAGCRRPCPRQRPDRRRRPHHRAHAPGAAVAHRDGAVFAEPPDERRDLPTTSPPPTAPARSRPGRRTTRMQSSARSPRPPCVRGTRAGTTSPTSTTASTPTASAWRTPASSGSRGSGRRRNGRSVPLRNNPKRTGSRADPTSRMPGTRKGGDNCLPRRAVLPVGRRSHG